MVVQPGCVRRGRRVTGVSGTSTSLPPSGITVGVVLTAAWAVDRRGAPGRRAAAARRGLPRGSESGGDGGRKTPDDWRSRRRRPGDMAVACIAAG